MLKKRARCQKFRLKLRSIGAIVPDARALGHTRRRDCTRIRAIAIAPEWCKIDKIYSGHLCLFWRSLTIDRWVRQELEKTQLGDVRRTNRFMKIVSNLINNPESSVPKAKSTFNFSHHNRRATIRHY
jgi:hypothetical protein